MRWPLSRKVKGPRAYLMESVEGFYWDGFEPPNDDMRGRLALEELARRIQRLLDSGQAAVEPNLEHEYMFHLYQAEKAMRTGCYALACHELQDVIHFRHGISRQVLTIVLHQIHSYLEV